MEPALEAGPVAFAGLAALVSNLVSNAPAVLLFRPLIGAMTDPGKAWYLLAMASTLAAIWPCSDRSPT